MADLTLDEARKEVAALRDKLDEWANAYYTKDTPEVA